jgi:hypothetical protein
MFRVEITVNGHVNEAGSFITFVEAFLEAERQTLNSTQHLQSYRVEVVELCGDHTRYAVYDKAWKAL